MIRVLETDNDVLKSIFKNRFVDGEEVSATIRKRFDGNIKLWEGHKDLVAAIPQKRSKTMDNRIFLAIESKNNKLTARPFKPIVLPANSSDDARMISDDLQAYFLELYKKRGVKKKVKRALRSLDMGSFFCIKAYWNTEIDDVDVAYVNPKNLRVAKSATCEEESEFAIETIDNKRLLDLLYKFNTPEEQKQILQLSGKTLEQAKLSNPEVKYEEMWVGDGVVWLYRDTVIRKERNPYYDFDGLLLTPEEKAELEQRDQDGKPTVNGRRRRAMFAKFKASQEQRMEQVKGNPDAAGGFESYLYNHHDKPRKPYIFGTVLEVEDSPIGRTTLIDVVSSLQDGISKRKRQIADNVDFVNGITKVDTNVTQMTLADARKAHYDPEGLVYGPGVSTGVIRETGENLPDMVFADMKDSREELDEIIGTTSTFRGSNEGNKETATGRAILREEGMSRLDEYVTLLDYVGSELYNWWMQLIKVKYTETHLIKGIGTAKAEEVLELMQDDLQEGTEVRIESGSYLPDDKLYRADRAREDVVAGLVDPVTYLKVVGGYDNPEETIKRAVMFKTVPFSIVSLDDGDIEKIQQGLAIMQQITLASNPPVAPSGAGDAPPEGDDGARAQKIAELRQRMEEIAKSPEFQALPPEQQRAKLGEMRSALESLMGKQK